MRISVAVCILGLAACTQPNSDAIRKFAGGVETVSTGMRATYSNINTLALEAQLIQDAREFALRERLDRSRDVVVVLDPKSPAYAGEPPERLPACGYEGSGKDRPPFEEPLSADVLKPRMEVLGALTEYASLLVALSDGSLTEGFAKEIAETGTRLSALETTITPLVPDIKDAKLAPFTQAVGAIGKILIDAGTARAIQDVAPQVHPELVSIVGTMKQELLFADVAVSACVNLIDSDMSAVLEELKGATTVERFASYRLYADIAGDYEARTGGGAKIVPALDALVRTHAKIIEGSPADLERAADRFLGVAEAVAQLIE